MKYDEWLEEDGLIKIEAWSRNGLTQEQIAKNMGVALSTLNDWKKKFPDISNALKRGKEVVDFEVENSLLKRAMGTTTKEVIKERDENGNMVVVKEIVKEIPPDVTAIIFWLKNRMKNEWRTNPTPDGEESLQALDAVLDRIKSAF